MSGRYGDSLSDMEQRIRSIVRQVFIDSHGFVRGAVNIRTLKPFTHQDVAHLKLGEMYTRNANIPWRMKKLIMNYEEADMATGDYLMSLVHKFRATGERTVREQARRVFEAIALLCENSFSTNVLGRGWLPKPYAGIGEVAEMCETSADQYTKITLGLDLYAREVATAAERRRAEGLILAFADWWVEHWYTTSYFGRCLWWWRHNSPHAQGWLLYILALAQELSGERCYGREFTRLWEFRGGLMRADSGGANSTNLGIECMERLWDLRPRRRSFWREALAANWAYCREIARPEGYVMHGPPSHLITMNTGPRVACSAAAMLHFVDDPGEVAAWTRRYLSRMDHKEMYLIEHPSTQHVRPGFAFHQGALSGHYYTAWLHAYWKLARLAPDE